MNGNRGDLLQLAKLMEQKEGLAGKILILTRKQRDVLLSAVPDDIKSLQDLQDLLDKRQSLMDEIDRIDHRIKSLNHGSHISHGEKESSLHETIKVRAENIKNIFHETHQIERNNQARLNKMKLDLSAVVKSLRTAKSISSKYSKLPGQVQGFFVDQKK